ncbi:unnamed protein product [Musa acuminata var. zebrina]
MPACQLRTIGDGPPEMTTTHTRVAHKLANQCACDTSSHITSQQQRQLPPPLVSPSFSPPLQSNNVIASSCNIESFRHVMERKIWHFFPVLQLDLFWGVNLL